MATITSQRSGNWLRDASNADSPWYGGGIASGVPTSADDVRLGEVYRACSISVASPAVVTLASHGYSNDDPVAFGTTQGSGAGTANLGAPIQPGVTYYVVYVSSSTFRLSTTPGGGNLVNTTQASSAPYVSKGCHTITLDGAGCICNTLIAYPGTVLKPTTSVDSDFTAQRDVTFTGGTSFDFDMSSVPTVKHTFNQNGLANGTNNYGILTGNGMLKLRLKGASRKRWTNTTGALTGQTSTSVHVSDATGWRVGDKIIFGTTKTYDGTSVSNTSNATYASGELTIPLSNTAPFVPGCHVLLSGFTSTNNLNTDWVVTSVTASTNIKIAGANPGASFTDAQGSVRLMPKTDTVTLTGITYDNAPTNTGAATISWTGAVAWDHASSAYVGNFSSNLEFKSSVVDLQAQNKQGIGFTIRIALGQSPDNSYLIDNVLFNGMCYDIYNQGAFQTASSAGVGSLDIVEGFNNNAFLNTAGFDIFTGYSDYSVGIPADSNIFYSEYQASNYRACVHFFNDMRNVSPWNNFVIFRSIIGLNQRPSFQEYNDWVISGCTSLGQANSTGFTGLQPFTRLKIFGCNTGMSIPGVGSQVFKSCEIGTTFGAANTIAFGTQVNGQLLMDKSYIQSALWDVSLVGYGGFNSSLFLKNRNEDIDLQDLYTHMGEMHRDVTGSPAAVNGDAVMRLEPKLLGVQEFAYESTIIVPAGATVEILGNVQRTASTVSMSLTASIDGITLGTPFTLSSGALNTWLPLSLSITNSEVTPQEITLTYTAIDSTVNTSKVYIDGIPETPFINKVRWYGYLYNETTKERVVNPAITELVEATAYAYTGIAVGTGTAPALTGITISSPHSFVELYDYTQAWARAHISYNVPTTAVLAGMLTAGTDVTLNDTLSGSGSLLLGSNTLTSVTPWNYSYTGGTFSQLSTIPAFSGGVLTIGAEATYNFTGSSLIIELTPSTAGVTYDLTGGTFSGTIYLKNLTAHAIFVSKEADPVFDTSLNIGGTITLVAPTINQAVVLGGLSTTCRIQLYDTDAAVELYNDEPGLTSFTWNDPAVASADRPIRLRITDYLGSTAKVMIERNIGTCGTTESTASISFNNEFEEDLNYNSHAAALGITGADVTDIEIDDSTNTVKFNFLSGGDYDARRIYMHMVYWLDTEVGIRDDFVFCSPLDPVNLPMTGVLFENVTSPQETITFINAYVYDATTGRAKDLIVGDGINFAPDHVVQVIATVGGVNIITGDIADIPTAAEVAAEIVANKETLTVSSFLGLQQE